jgi:hypothetical protein
MKRVNIVFVAIVFLAIIGVSSGYFHTDSIRAKVTGKERVTQMSGKDNFKSFYLVYTDHGTVKLEDDLFRGNLNSSDVYGSLKEDSTYTFKISGYRIGLLNMYPNIIEVK